MADARGMDDAGTGIDDWFRSLPVITRYWFASAFCTTIGANFGIVSPMKLIYSLDNIKDNFEVWRLITPFMYVGKFDINTLIGLFMLYQFSRQYESGGPYNTGAGGGTADYAFALLFAVVTMIASFHLLRGMMPLAPLFVRNLVFFVLYLWSKKNPTSNSSIWGVPVKGMYLPFAYLALNVLMGNPFFDVLHGIAMGHIYYFLVDVVPIVYGKDVLHTPQFLIDHFGIGEYVTPTPAATAGGRP
eukprot:CAMPEP_0183323686 /NCGR_PEP_ID=MMETSP0160_2-20130417/75097_1 /TAXON_ID=2839 ORGANISM="Odontella Sinensis, Strain Grunow 1884" /NCGR_SAMPLE_ID=MMETSP0160_2 /ASSEMBLY_ACC=CAM_ASM_000250 /LENGTH=243 /DNA_ID=CAMNT_0025491109 /DNA_START=242 /DNA_END=969 /DNA_ORIENTATION=+